MIMKKLLIFMFSVLYGIMSMSAQYRVSVLTCDMEEEEEQSGMLKEIIDPSKGSNYNWGDKYTGSVVLRTTNTNPPVYFMLYSDIIDEPFENNVRSGWTTRKYDVGEKYRWGHFGYGRVNTDPSSFSADRGNKVTYEVDKYSKYYPNDPSLEEFGPLWVVDKPSGTFSFQYRSDSTPEKWVTVELTYTTKPGIVTEVIDLQADKQDDTIYDLQGRVLREKPNGLYIQNGKLYKN